MRLWFSEAFDSPSFVCCFWFSVITISDRHDEPKMCENILTAFLQKWLCFSFRSEKLSEKLQGKTICSDLSATVLTRCTGSKQNNPVLLSCHTASVLGSYQFGKATTNTLLLYREQFWLMRNSKKSLPAADPFQFISARILMSEDRAELGKVHQAV